MAKKNRAMKRYIKAANNYEYITCLRNPSAKLRVPKDGASPEAVFMMQYAMKNTALYAVDNSPLGAEMNVASANELDEIGMVQLNLVDANTSEEKMMMLPKANIDALKRKLIQNNFSSYEAFKTNLLPTFNAPDGACFVGLTDPDDGIQYGFKVDLPTKSI